MSSFLIFSLCLCTALAQVDVVGPEYTALPAVEKQAWIWYNTLLDTSSNSWPSALQLVGIFFESMCPTFEAAGDQLPTAWIWNTRQHSVGSVGMVEFVSSGSRYTGLFQGATHGIVRISPAKEPEADVLNTTPGMGLKFLRDGVESASLVAMYGVDGQESWNVFANSWSNHIGAASRADTLALSVKFAKGTPNIQQVGLSDWARFGEDGVRVPDSDMVFPYKLVFT